MSKLSNLNLFYYRRTNFGCMQTLKKFSMEKAATPRAVESVLSSEKLICRSFCWNQSAWFATRFVKDFSSHSFDVAIRLPMITCCGLNVLMMLLMPTPK